MAVTIQSQPGTHTPAFNEQYFVATSTNSSQTNFKYVVSVLVAGVTITEKYEKRPDNSKLYFNPQRIVDAYVKNEFYPAILDFQNSIASNEAQAIMQVTVGIDEEYGSPASGFTGASGTYYVWNAAYKALDFASFTYITSNICKDLTLSPSYTDTIHFDQLVLYKTWHRGFSTRDLRYLTITCYNSSNVQIQQSVIENQFYDTTGVYRRNYIILNCSPYGLNNFTGPLISKSDPLLDIVPSDTYRYTMAGTNTGGDPSTSTYTVYIDDYCSKYTRYVLHFLNRLGNYDSFTFNLLSRYTTDKESKSYKKTPYALNGSNEYAYTKSSEDTVTYGTTLTNKMVLNSDWITDNEASWLRDLIMSPSIFLEDPDTGDFYSVKCTSKSYETKKKVNEMVFNITIDIEYALQDIRQRG